MVRSLFDMARWAALLVVVGVTSAMLSYWSCRAAMGAPSPGVVGVAELPPPQPSGERWPYVVACAVLGAAAGLAGVIVLTRSRRRAIGATVTMVAADYDGSGPDSALAHRFYEVLWGAALERGISLVRWKDVTPAERSAWRAVARAARPDHGELAIQTRAAVWGCVSAASALVREWRAQAKDADFDEAGTAQADCLHDCSYALEELASGWLDGIRLATPQDSESARRKLDELLDDTNTQAPGGVGGRVGRAATVRDLRAERPGAAPAGPRPPR